MRRPKRSGPENLHRIQQILLCLALAFVPSQQWLPMSCVSINQRRQAQNPFASLQPRNRGSSLRVVDFDSLMEMDVAIYSLVDEKSSSSEHQKKYLGAMEEDGTLAPLCVWSSSPAFDNSLEFLVDEEDRPGFSKEQVVVHSLLDQSDFSYGSRQVGGGMGPGNPHGEESELLYYVDQDAVEGVELLVKPELEIFW